MLYIYKGQYKNSGITFMSYGDVYNTTVNVNGNTVFRSRYNTNCCCGYSSRMSCFGFGYGGYGCWPGSFEAGLGAGVGFAAGRALIPALPLIFKGISQGLGWIGSKVIAPAATFAWNNVLKPVGGAVWSGLKWAGTGIWNGAKAVGKGIWNGIKWIGNKIGSIFHKKSKAKTEEAK